MDSARIPILPMRAEGLGFSAGGASVLTDVSFEIAPASRTIILGPNGAGKSVLLRLLHGLLEPGAGRVQWAAADARAGQAMVFQSPVMLRRSALENVEFALKVAGRGEVRERAMHALERVGLTPLAERPARLCSGGEQQRIAIARAWATEPEVLFLDEPTASLDPTATSSIEEAILAMHSSGTAIVMTTHDMGQAKRLAERVLFLHRGRLVEDTPADEFFNQPRSREATAFIKGELLW
jgi:tungstate transport system ATP-binding protein